VKARTVICAFNAMPKRRLLAVGDGVALAEVQVHGTPLVAFGHGGATGIIRPLGLATKAAIESSQVWQPKDMTPEQSTRVAADWISSIRAGQIRLKRYPKDRRSQCNSDACCVPPG